VEAVTIVATKVAAKRLYLPLLRVRVALAVHLVNNILSFSPKDIYSLTRPIYNDKTDLRSSLVFFPPYITY